jgi:hypothetical protein
MGTSVVKKGKKRKSISKVREESPFKHCLVSGPSGEHVSLPAPHPSSSVKINSIVGEPMSIGNLLFD